MILLFYTKGCSPHIQEFRSLSSAKRFANAFRKNADNWVDFIIDGKIVKAFPESEGIVYIKLKSRISE